MSRRTDDDFLTDIREAIRRIGDYTDAMGDRLVHHYFGINLDVVWDIVTVQSPGLASEIDRIPEARRAG